VIDTIYTSIHDCNRSTFRNFRHQQGGERERERERERDEIDRRSICGKDIVRCKTFNKIYKEIERGRFIFNFYKHVK